MFDGNPGLGLQLLDFIQQERVNWYNDSVGKAKRQFGSKINAAVRHLCYANTLAANLNNPCIANPEVSGRDYLAHFVNAVEALPILQSEMDAIIGAGKVQFEATLAEARST